MFNIIKNSMFKKVNILGKDENRIKSKKLKSDFNNIVFLLLLYMIQGIPLGVSQVIPLLIQDKVSYSRLSIFSLVSLPFSLKLLWAPLVDSKYFKVIGRRKTWIIPLQTICGILMIYFSKNVSIWLEDGGNARNLYLLTLYFFVLFFLMATQDIAVDGWAITMLSKRNRHLASTCNILGQNFGNSLSELSFLTLHSKKICFYLFKKYIYFMHIIFNKSSYYKNVHENIEFAYPAFQPFLDMNYYLKFWGSFILLLTVFTFIKKEANGNKKCSNTKIIPKEKKIKKKYSPLTDNATDVEFEDAPKDRSFIDKKNIYTDNKHFKDKKILNKNVNVNIEDVVNYNQVEGEEDEDEDDDEEEEEDIEVVKSAYKKLYKLIYLPPIKLFVALSVLSRLPFASVEVGTNFKILKRGITKEEFAIFNPFYIPVTILSPALIGNVLKKIEPLNVFYFGYKIRFLSNLLLSTLLPATHYMYLNKTKISSYHFILYYVYIFITQAFNLVCIDFMRVSSMGFQNIISDPKIGGTYMTFLNTVNNLSSYVAKATFLWLFDYTDTELCYKGKCVLVDGYYIQMVLSLAIGTILSHFIFKYIKQIQDFPIESWRLDYEDTKTVTDQKNSAKKLHVSQFV